MCKIMLSIKLSCKEHVFISDLNVSTAIHAVRAFIWCSPSTLNLWTSHNVYSPG